jgi:transcriptional regulator with PAS, ATPase and Fis domain
MKRVYEAITAVAGNRSNVLIQGETGTGKELVARAVHYGGTRAEKPFIALNCGSVSKTLLESQLFGHVKGAFTGAIKDSPGYFVAAAGGTLFLDEITEIDTETQVRLLRAIQEHEVTPVGGTTPLAVDVRIVAATNRDLSAAVEDGLLRRDLYYRLSVVVIEIPPLRQRREDIPELIAYFNEHLSAEYGLSPREISPAAMELLLQHEWPGNVRELENVIERAFALGNGAAIDVADLPTTITTRREPGPETCGPVKTLQSTEELLVRRALAEAGGNKSLAARTLGIDRKRLYRMIRRFGLEESTSLVSSASGGNQ